MVFYRKYRPQKLSEIIGQEHVTETLLAQLESGKISHGYLFAGPKGTGKTSTARIFAKAVNCQGLGKLGKLGTRKKLDSRLYELDSKFGEPCNKCDVCISITNGSFLDLIEIDAASNRGIDDVRDLREKIKLLPVSGMFKVYIIDEAQMLTTEAFSALLKTLEEPPAHAIFILCTTQAGKIPGTILSRLARFNFSRASAAELAAACQKVVNSENIKIETDALAAVARAGDGSFRDALTILDQLAPLAKKITASDVAKISKAADFDQLLVFMQALAAFDLAKSIGTIEEIAGAGGNMSLFGKEIVLFGEKVLLTKLGAADNLGEIDSSRQEEIQQLASEISLAELTSMMKLFLIAENEMKIYPQERIPLILAVCKYCEGQWRERDGENQMEEAAVVKDKAQSGKSVQASVQEKVGKKTKSLGAFSKKWQQFLEKLRPVNVQLVALLRSTRPIEFDGKNLTLAVFYRFHKDKLEERKVLAMIEGMLKEVMGTGINIKMVLASRENTPPVTVRRSNVVDVASEDISRVAQEVFSK